MDMKYIVFMLCGLILMVQPRLTLGGTLGVTTSSPSFVTTEAPSVSGCTTGDDTCCDEENLCAEGEGDCDSDSDCMEGLECGRDNCPYEGDDWDYGDDCCYDPTKTSGCMGGNACCSVKDCFEGEGDCDTDSQCVEGLVCGSDNCMSVYSKTGMDWDESDDCCTPDV